MKYRINDLTPGGIYNGLAYEQEIEPLIIKEIRKKNGKEYVCNRTKRRGIFVCPICGEKTILFLRMVAYHEIASCGCASHKIKHGLSYKRIYRIWNGMKNRCSNPDDIGFKHYGGRGIKVCDEWLGENGLENFNEWAMTNGYKDNLTIDRINVDGNYEPSNCRWVTYLSQANNKRNNHFITYKGETHSVAEWAKITGIKSLHNRISRGWDIERALTEPTHTKGRIWEQNQNARKSH